MKISCPLHFIFLLWRALYQPSYNSISCPWDEVGSNITLDKKGAFRGSENKLVGTQFRFITIHFQKTLATTSRLWAFQSNAQSCKKIDLLSGIVRGKNGSFVNRLYFHHSFTAEWLRAAGSSLCWKFVDLLSGHPIWV